MGKFDKEYEKELLFQLHEQFSGNQNDTSSRFVTILIGVLVLFGAFGLAFSRSLELIVIEDLEVKFITVILLSFIVDIVLFYLVSTLIYQGYQHRRDQYINNKIRKNYVINHAEYFQKYTGNKNKAMDFIPDYIFIQIKFLYCLKIILSLSLILCFYKKHFEQDFPSTWCLIAIVFQIFTLILLSFRYLTYNTKYRNYYNIDNIKKTEYWKGFWILPWNIIQSFWIYKEITENTSDIVAVDELIENKMSEDFCIQEKKEISISFEVQYSKKNPVKK